MRALILVDLDNVIGDGLLELVGDARPCLEKRRSSSLKECVTAFAFNTVTGYSHNLTWRSLEDAARAFATALGATQSRVEIALALPMPQAADVLLARLARSAPTDAAGGPYHLAVLMSQDNDLARDLGGEVFARDKSRWVQLERGWLSAWGPTPGAAPLVRKPPERARASGSEAVALSGAYTELVSELGHAGWARERPLDLGPDRELRALSVRLEEDPWLLSQIGATQRSLRGIARLPLGAEVLGPVCSKDGVELRGDAPRPTRLSALIAASVGIGAVRSPIERATVASRLPVGVLQAALGGGGARCDRGGVSPQRALQRAAVGAALTDDPVEVRLRIDRRALVAKVKHDSTHQPRAWWLAGERRVTTEQRIDGAARFLPASVRTSGVPYRTAGSPIPLALRCPLEPGAQVRCDAAIAQGTIGQAWWCPPLGKARPIAVYAPRHIAPTEGLRVEPVHSASHGPSELRDIPLMVAQP
jgi:hypothetical protein